MANVDYPAILDGAWSQHLASRENNAPTVISTFSGCGGSSLGYSMAGYRESLAIEWNENAVRTFRLNMSDIPIYHGDIMALTVAECLRLSSMEEGELDLLDGSPPCQGFSQAGKRNPDDERNQLFREYVRLLRGLKPKLFIMENVSGLVEGKMKIIFAEMLRQLKDSGYRVSVRLLNAMYFQVPQSRERLIFIGVRNDLEIEPSHPKATTIPISVRDALWNVPADQRKQPNISPLKQERWRETARGHAHKDRFALLRLAWDKSAPTILKTPGSGGHMHPDVPRLLTLTELRRLSSFPDQFEFVGTWLDGVERIGNAVPPLFMRAIAQHVRALINI